MPSNPLTDVLPPQVRKYVYAVLFLAALILGIWRATDGDVVETILGVLAALGFGTAASNTPTARTTTRHVPTDRGAVDYGLIAIAALVVAVICLVLILT